MIYRISRYDNKFIEERNSRDAIQCLETSEGLKKPKFPKYLKDL